MVSDAQFHLPNLSRASAIAWFFTMSMSPRPRQKWGKMRKTDFRMSLMSFSFCLEKKSGTSEPAEQNAATTAQERPMLSLTPPSLPQHSNPTKIQGLEMFSQEPGPWLLWTVSVMLLKMLLTQANCNKSFFPNTHSLKGSVCKQWHAKRLLAEDTGKLNLHRLVMSVAVGSSFLSHIGSSNVFPLLGSSWLQSHGLNW